MYLLTGEAKVFETYQTSIAQAQQKITDAKQHLENKSASNETLNTAYDELEEDLQKLAPIVEQVKQIQSERALEFPAFEYVNSNMMPVAMQTQQILNSMVNSELSELGESRQLLLENIINLQKKLAQCNQ